METKKSVVDLLLSLSIKNTDFADAVKEKDGVVVLVTLFINSDDFDLKSKITNLILLLSLSRQSGVATQTLMNEINILSLVNLFMEKDFKIIMQTFSGLKLMEKTLKEKSGSSSQFSLSMSLTAATLFLENIASLVDPSSKLLTDGQKADILANFTQFVLTGAINQAAADAAKDFDKALVPAFSLAFQKFVKAVKGCKTNDHSLLDIVSIHILQLVEEDKLITFGLMHLKDNLNFINMWLGGCKKYKLLYKASVDGFAGSTFHSKCDNKGATVTIITCTKDFVFGGYAAVAWNGDSYNTADSSKQSFLFSLRNPHDTPPKKFPLKDSSSAIHSNGAYGPIFGAYPQGYDILCHTGMSSNENYTNIGTSYDPTPFVHDGDGKTALTGEFKFTAKEVEVYQVQ